MSQWSEEYKVNVAVLDEQHKMLFHLLDDLDNCLKGDTTEEVSFIIGELHAYALYHFAAEERLLARFNYPGLDAHRTEHREFEAKVFEFRSRSIHPDPELPAQMKDFLENWIANHIKKTDQEYSEFFNSYGIF